MKFFGLIKTITEESNVSKQTLVQDYIYVRKTNFGRPISLVNERLILI